MPHGTNIVAKKGLYLRFISFDRRALEGVVIHTTTGKAHTACRPASWTHPQPLQQPQRWHRREHCRPHHGSIDSCFPACKSHFQKLTQSPEETSWRLLGRSRIRQQARGILPSMGVSTDIAADHIITASLNNTPHHQHVHSCFDRASSSIRRNG